MPTFIRSASLEGALTESAEFPSPADPRKQAPPPGSQQHGSLTGAGAGASASASRSLASAERKSFTLTLDLVGTRLEAQANTSQLNACYNYQRKNPSLCGERGIYNDLNLATRVDYLTGIPFSHEKNVFSTQSSKGIQKGARVFDGALVYRDTTIQNEAEHLLSLNGMAACFGIPSASFFDGTATSRKTLVALCSLAGSLRSTNQTKSNHLLQTVTENSFEVTAAFENCKKRVNNLNLMKSEKNTLIQHLDRKKTQGWAFKPNDRLIKWLANSFYTGTDTKPGAGGVGSSSIRFIDFPYCICMGRDGTPHENFIRYFVKTYLKGSDQEKYDRFIHDSSILMTSQSQLICDILNMYVDWDTLVRRCIALGKLKDGENPNTIPFFNDFKTHGVSIVKCINFEIKADTLYPHVVAAARAVVVAPPAILQRAQSFFSSFEGNYKAIIGRLTGRGAPLMRFNIHTGFFILKRNEFLAAAGAPAAAGACAAGAPAGAPAAAMNTEGEALLELSHEEKALINCASEDPASQSQAPNYDPNQENLPQDERIRVVENADAALTILNAADAAADAADDAPANAAAADAAPRGAGGLFVEGRPWPPAAAFAAAAGGRPTVGGLRPADPVPEGHTREYFRNTDGTTRLRYVKKSPNGMNLRLRKTRKRNRKQRKTRKV